MAADPVRAILALDQGTHASRAQLWALDGRLLHETRVAVALHREGERVEQDAGELLGSLRECLEAAGGWASEHAVVPVAAGLATQRSTVVAYDRRDGAPLAPALSWQDTRAAAALDRHADRAAEIRRRTGLRLSPHYGASKIAWLLAEQPAVRTAAEAGHLVAGPLASYLLHHLLTGRPVLVDEVNAARTLLWNVRERRWDPELAAPFGIPPGVLPAAHPTLHDYGGLRQGGVPVTAVNGDQNAACFAAGTPPADAAIVNLGTGAFVLAEAEPRALESAPELLVGVASSDAAGCRWLLEGTVNGAGAALEWLAEAEGAAASLEPWPACAEPALFLNTVGGLGSPWWRSGLEPAFLDEAASPACRLAGVAESILFLLQANIDCMRAAGVAPRRLRVSGGLAHSDELCQRLADLGAVAVERADQPEATGRGIAWLAAGGPAGWARPPVTRFEPREARGLRARQRRFLDELRGALAA